LVETRGHACLAKRIQQAQRSDRVHLGGVFRHFEGDLDVALRGQVVDLVRLNLGHQPVQVVGVEHVAVVQREAIPERRIGVHCVDAAAVERARAPYYAVYVVALAQQ